MDSKLAFINKMELISKRNNPLLKHSSRSVINMTIQFCFRNTNSDSMLVTDVGDGLYVGGNFEMMVTDLESLSSILYNEKVRE